MKMNLTIYRNEVVPVYTTDKGNKVVNGRELHSFLAIGKDYSNWAKGVIKKHNLVEGKDYVAISHSEIITDLSLAKSGEQSLAKKQRKGGQNRIEYIFLQDPAKKIAMGTNNEQGDLVKDYFIRIEKEFKASLQPAPDFSIHTHRPVQIQNSKEINRHLWETKDVQAIGDYHRDATKEVCGKTPSQLKKEAKAAGMPSKFRTSGREVLRHTKPEAACALSLCDQLSKSGASFDQIKPLLNKAQGLYADIIKLGFTPNELTT